MRIKIPEFSDKKELHRYLIANKSKLIEMKKALPIKSDNFSFGAIKQDVSGIEVKALENTALMPGSNVVDVIGNLAMYADHSLDVLITDCWNKSIREKGTKLPFIHDHIHESLNRVAKTLDVYTAMILTKSLGLKSNVKEAQGLIFKGETNPKINLKAHDFYQMGLIDQHSIGLQYIQLDLAINDPDEKPEFKTYEKYIDQIVNPEKVEKYGYFWAIKEIRLIELSCVLFGCNDQTDVLSVETAESLQEQEAGKSTSKIEQPKSDNSKFYKRLAAIDFGT